MTSATKHITRPGKPSSDIDTYTVEYRHEEMVAGLAKPGSDIAHDLNENVDRANVLLGTCRDFVEAGTSLDAAKKYVVYNKQDVDFVHPCEEGNFNVINDSEAHLLHMAIGIAGEASELLEAVLAAVDGDVLDTENCTEELGDIEFYMAGFRQGLAKARGTILQGNIDKLGVRYKGHQYSDDQAQNRADKA